MDSDNVVDNQDQLGYNVGQNDLYASEIFKMDEHEPINDTTCKHETLVADLEDKIGDAVYHGCANKKCGVGFYIQTNKNIT